MAQEVLGDRRVKSFTALPFGVRQFCVSATVPVEAIGDIAEAGASCPTLQEKLPGSAPFDKTHFG